MIVEHWYVVKTMVRSEKKVCERLSEENFDVYLPMVTTIRTWSDRKKKVSMPLIASTLFVRTSPDKLKYVYQCQGVCKVLTYLGKPAIVREVEIQNLQILLGEDQPELVETTLGVGEAVEVVRGPFQGLIGTALRTNECFRIVIELQSLNTGFVVNIPKSFVRKYKAVEK